ncbi:MAG: glycosyltransferase [Deltaproteobacteria bacterium]|nr:glycosyltransferase [Deltaproteobacteria bacterium]
MLCTPIHLALRRRLRILSRYAVMVWVLLILVGCAVWAVALAMNIVMLRRIRRLDRVQAPAPKSWPRLSVVIPACNEADTLELALQSVLAQDYPELQVILVDDRSSDDTGAIMERIAARDARVEVLHVEHLPEGWLGKVHAMQYGLQKADGQLLLFTDADVRFAPGALRRAVAFVEHEAADHLAIIPDAWSESFVVNTCIAAAFRTIALSQRPWRMESPDTKDALGSGAFNLVRRSAFEATEGFSWLKMEVADDVALGHLMKQSGARARLLIGTGQVQVAWYPTFRSMVRGLEKNGFAQIARFSLLRAVVLAAAATWLSLAPFVAFTWAGAPGLWVAGLLALLSSVAGSFLLGLLVGFPILPMLLSTPFGDLILVGVVLRAAVLGTLRGGLVWRGTVYPVAALRAGVRVKF